MISVIIPMYNAQSTILPCLDSVIHQTYKGKMEIIVVNDGSKDESKLIVEQYINEHKDFTIQLIDKPNGGVSSARNAGLRNAKGEYMALLDSDDEWLANKIERQIEIFESNSLIDFLGTNRNGEVLTTIGLKKITLLTKFTSKLLLIKFVFQPSTVIFKSKIVSDIGYFDETQKYAEEGNYFIRIANTYNCYLLNESWVLAGGGKFHYGHSGLSGNLKEMEKGELKNLKYAFKNGMINFIEYPILVVFSLMKYFRRLMIVKLR